MKNQLITLFGGGGFVGRYVVQELLKAGARVRIAQRDPRQALYLKTQGGLGQTQFVAADLSKPETVARAVAGSDGVVNLVGVLAGDFDKVHVAGARTVAEAAQAAGATAFVQISAIGADANSPSAYGRSKAGGEEAVRQAFPGATILRPSIVFGREDGFVNRFAGMIARAPALIGRPIVPVMAASAKFQPVYVVDLAQVIVKALGDPDRFGGQTYAIGGPDVVTMGGLNRWIAQAIGRDVRFLEIPNELGSVIAAMPLTPISKDQWAMLSQDNVVGDGVLGIEAFDQRPVPMATVAPDWLVQYRKSGRFGRIAELKGA
ncbi:3-beta hydroxysteroid dehydrogenase [Sphingomonas sp. Leaf407]|uniref:complex I NDUFA9 subunit family protein n=1 Tax=unclassified Sphingomonas TaxID=196159 RepID=UPI0006F4924D|nr:MULTISPECIES: complex I NDUFA9 subunit family protein [unclassified Sphingomonas]KQN35512.1 3-beta hydroxysteroid dehydrogenase [Sphingomonas sp. Leaf42]KQT26379.1 3-beta hydroxysteroid dehydrogenase [Sphingomonas sp. Leaf407]